jgi:glycosyltransferase involved in cell wall biosynthesis
MAPSTDRAAGLRIAIFVHGRFHAFDLAAALERAGVKVTVFTNYPRQVARRFGLDSRAVRSFWAHGVAHRAAARAGRFISGDWLESWTHRIFGRWAARQLKHRDFDVVHLWSGVAEESLLFLARTKPRQLTVVVRGSVHIRKQRELLLEEERRAGVPMEVPSLWRVAREEREYRLASAICTISSFAYDSFRAAGVPEERLILATLGVDVRAFQPSLGGTEARMERIRSGRPLRVLTVGTLSFRKGALDYQQVVESVPELFRFRFVGTVAEECRELARGLRQNVEFIGRKPQAELPAEYHAADLFLFPTIEDGFAQVLAQAHAAGLPIIATRNSCAADLIEHGKTGWITAARDAGAMSDYLLWCHQNREPIVEICRTIARQPHIRSWDNMAQDYMAAVTARLAGGMGQPGGRQFLGSSFPG